MWPDQDPGLPTSYSRMSWDPYHQARLLTLWNALLDSMSSHKGGHALCCSGVLGAGEDGGVRARVPSPSLLLGYCA